MIKACAITAGRILAVGAWAATTVLAVREVSSRMTWLHAEDGASRTSAAAMILPDADVVAFEGDEDAWARAVAIRPRDPRMLALAAGPRWSDREAEAVRLLLRAADVAPYAGRLASEAGARILEVGERRAREAVEWRERARRATEAKAAGAEELEVEARQRMVRARGMLEALLELDRRTGPSAPGRRALTDQTREVRQWLTDLGFPP
jgi:hypothetical protein